MYARIVRSQVPPERLDELVPVIKRQIAPTAEQQPGFRGMVVLSDPGTGVGMLMTFWESASDLLAGETSGYLNRQLAAVAPWLTAPAVRETYEVNFKQLQ